MKRISILEDELLTGDFSGLQQVREDGELIHLILEIVTDSVREVIIKSISGLSADNLPDLHSLMRYADVLEVRNLDLPNRIAENAHVRDRSPHLHPHRDMIIAPDCQGYTSQIQMLYAPDHVIGPPTLVFKIHPAIGYLIESQRKWITAHSHELHSQEIKKAQQAATFLEEELTEWKRFPSFNYEALINKALIDLQCLLADYSGRVERILNGLCSGLGQASFQHEKGKAIFMNSLTTLHGRLSTGPSSALLLMRTISDANKLAPSSQKH